MSGISRGHALGCVFFDSLRPNLHPVGPILTIERQSYNGLADKFHTQSTNSLADN